MDNNRFDIEVSILGALIEAGADSIGEHIAQLSPEDFGETIHRDIYTAVRKLFLAGRPVDKLTVVAELGSEYNDYVTKACARCVAARHNLAAYIDLLHRYALMEKIRACGSALSYAEKPEDCAATIDELNGLMVTKAKRQPVSFADALQGFYERHTAAKPEYLRFGFELLDKKLCAESADYIALGGYPSSGKTALAAQFALEFARRGKRVGFFSLETKPEKLTDRIMASVMRKPLWQIKNNEFTEAEWRKFYGLTGELSTLCLDQIPAAEMTVHDIRAVSLSRRYEVIFIDYLQLVRGSSSRGQRYEEVTDVSMGLHALAQSTGITVIALAQLSRPEKTKGQKLQPPSMSSFRESGQIEQDIDIGLLLYPEDPDSPRGRRILKICKNKDGELDATPLEFDGPTQTFKQAEPTQSEKYAKYNHEMAEVRKSLREGKQAAQVSMSDLEEPAKNLPF